MFEEVTRLASIVCSLEAWINDKTNHDQERSWAANFVWSPTFCSIHIGEICLWEDQNSGSDNCNLEYCKQQWIEYVDSVRMFRS